MAKNWLFLQLALISALAQGGESRCVQLVFAGEVQSTNSYTQALGMGLEFRMEALKDNAGWTFEIGPADPAPDEFNSYIYALNPPYRGRNVADLSTQYGTPAEQAVGSGDHNFWFLTRRSDAAVAQEALNHVLWPSDVNDQEAALSRLGSLAMGVGVVRIVAADIVPSKRIGASDQPDYGAIYRLAFEVELIVPADFQSVPELTGHSADCPAANAWSQQWAL